MNRNLGVSAGLVALLGLMFHIAPPVSEKPKELSKESGSKAGREGDRTKPADPSTEPLEGPWLATWELWGRPQPPQTPPNDEATKKSQVCFRTLGDPATTEVCKETLAALFGVTGEARSKIYSILATVPDPIHSRLALFTDGSLDAIETSANASGWIFASRWLPWLDPMDPDEKDPTLRRQQRRLAREQEAQPGLLVFRRRIEGSTIDPAILLVFLVGEKPTSGIDREQFRNARAYMKTLQTDSSDVFIQGPTFSGSFYSLRKLIEADGASSYVIRTGTATSDQDASALGHPPKVDFRGANMDANDIAHYFDETLREMRIPSQDAAILLEDESAFASAVESSAKSPGQAESPCAIGRSPIRVLRFPREISHLRNAYRESKGPNNDKVLPPDVDFTLKDRDLGEDSIPTFSTVQSPLSQNALLDGIMKAIRRDHIRVVQIVSTNVLDALFLSRVVREESPDTRIVMADAQLLLVEAARAEGLTGILAIASYPMFSESNWWKDPAASVIPFPNSDAEGIYNATSMLLRKIPPFRDTLSDYGWRPPQQPLCTAQLHPPVYLLALDRDGFLPVRAWSHSDDHTGSCGQGAEDRDHWWAKEETRAIEPILAPLPSRNWTFVASLTSVTGLSLMIWSGLIWWSDRHHKPWLWDGRFAVDAEFDKAHWRLFYLSCLFLSLAAMHLVLLVPWFHRLEANSFVCFGIFETVCLVIFAAVAAKGFSNRINARRWIVVSVLLSMIAVIAAWAGSCFSRAEYAGLFFSLRAVELRVGSSPSIPVLVTLATLAAYCVVHLTRLYLAACQEPEVVLDLDSALQQRLQDVHASLQKHLHSCLGLVKLREWSAVAGVATLVFTLGFSCHPFRHLAAVEDREFNLLLIALQSLMLAMMLHAGVQISALWSDLKSFLLSLGALPLAGAFIARSRSQSNRPVWVRSLNLQSLSMLVRGGTVVHDLSLRSGPEFQRMFRQHQEDVRDLLMSPHPGDTRADLIDRYKQIRSRAILIARGLFNETIRAHWRKTPLVGMLEQMREGKLNESDPPGQIGIPGDPTEPGDLAQTFVALHLSPFLIYGVRQIRNLAWFLSLGFLLLAASLTTYSPQSPQTVSRFLFAAFVLFGAVLWRCLAGIERDPILSRIEGTKAGELNAEFYLKLAGYGALPIVGLLASQFPAIANFLFSWIEPTLEALH